MNPEYKTLQDLIEKTNPLREKTKFYIATRQLNNGTFWWETYAVRKTLIGIIDYVRKSYYYKDTNIKIYEFDFDKANLLLNIQSHNQPIKG